LTACSRRGRLRRWFSTYGSPTSEPDLFWALRGGGGNFGVVTSFEFRAHPLGPIVAFAGVFYPVADAARILPRWRDYCASAPDEVSSVAIAISFPADPHLPPPVHNQACLVIAGVYTGAANEGMGVMQPLRELGTPLADISQPMPFTVVQSAFDGFFPMGKLHSYWKAQHLPALPDEALSRHRRSCQTAALTAHARRDLPDGRRNQPGGSERDGLCRTIGAVDVVDRWQLGESADTTANIAWVRESFRKIAPYSNGMTYTSFTGQADETASTLTANAYGANLDRLRRIKAHYDPHNFFRLNPNVEPAPAVVT
jgi:FAD/FMN-containing dehydrogenase